MPKSFTLDGGRPRIVFDFHDVVPSKKIKNTISANGTFIKNIRLGIHKGKNPKTRVVLDVQPGMKVEFTKNLASDSRTLTIRLFAAGMPPVEELPDTKPQKAKPAQTASVKKTKKETVPTTASTRKAPDESTVIKPLSKVGAQAKKEENGSTAPTLYSIEFDDSSHRGEIISFKLNGFYPPVVFGIEEDVPRIVCFFKDTKSGEDLKELIESNGKFIKKVKISKYHNPDNIRVVLDLVPGKNYDLQQIFFKEENLFMVILNTTGEKAAG